MKDRANLVKGGELRRPGVRSPDAGSRQLSDRSPAFFGSPNQGVQLHASGRDLIRGERPLQLDEFIKLQRVTILQNRRNVNGVRKSQGLLRHPYIIDPKELRPARSFQFHDLRELVSITMS